MNLGKEFVRAAVRQLGRDGGKVISNKVYKGKHSTPIYHHNPNLAPSNNFNQTSNQTEYVDVTEIDFSIQPEVKGPNLWVVLKGILIQIIPLGTIAVIIQAIRYVTKKDEYIFTRTPNRVPDKRYKDGFRIDGYSIVKTNQKRLLQDAEKKRLKWRGYLYFVSVILFFGCAYFFYLESEKTVVSDASKEYIYAPLKSNLNVRSEQSSNSSILFQIPAQDSALIIEENGLEEVIQGKNGKWIKIKYNEKTGWVWSGVVKEQSTLD